MANLEARLSDSLSWLQRGEVVQMFGAVCYVQRLTARETSAYRWGGGDGMASHYARRAKGRARTCRARVLKVVDYKGSVIVEVRL